MHDGSTTDTAPGIIRTSIKLDPSVHEAGKQLAKEDLRDFQSWVAATIKDLWRERHGDKPFPEPKPTA